MIKYELRCEICQSKFDSNYNIPKVLICGHTVCSKCVDRMKEKNISRCPFDRKLIDYDDDKIANNYYILSLIDGSIKDNSLQSEQEVEELFQLNPKPVINSPGWKNTLNGFIRGEIMYTIESNGFFYCTDLVTGEWWFLYLNQFWGNHFFQMSSSNKMYMIDHTGNLFQIFTKNYYTQIGKKNAWKNTTHLCVLNEKMYTLETSNKLYETNLETGRWKELGAKKKISEEEVTEENEGNTNSNAEISSLENDSEEEANDDSVEQISLNQNNNAANNQQPSSNTNSSVYGLNIAGISIKIPNSIQQMAKNANNNNLTNKMNNKLFKKDPIYSIIDATMMIATEKNILVSNKKGELYLVNEATGESMLLKTDFSKNIDSYSNNKTHVYFFEKGSKIIYRMFIGREDINEIYKSCIEEKYQPDYSSNIMTNNEKHNINNEIYNKMKIDNKNVTTLETKLKNKCSITSLESVAYSIQDCKLNFEIEKFLELDENMIPLKIIADDEKLAVTDKKGELSIYKIENKQCRKFQCLFMLRNCHLHNTILVGDGDLLILDPIRLSLNKLNILSGSEVIVLHSLKFLATIKFIFSCNSKVYFIDVSGSLFHFIESEKKMSQVGNSGICKYILDFAVHKNFLFTIENNTLYRTNLSDGNFVEIKNDITCNYKYFFADNVHLIFISKNDEILIVNPSDTLNIKRKIYFENISKRTAVVYFKNHLIYYNNEKNTIEALNLEKEYEENKNPEMNPHTDSNCDKYNDYIEKKGIFTLTENFPEVSLFINNNDCLACILKDGVIYKLYC